MICVCIRVCALEQVTEDINFILPLHLDFSSAVRSLLSALAPKFLNRNDCAHVKTLVNEHKVLNRGFSNQGVRNTDLLSGDVQISVVRVNNVPDEPASIAPHKENALEDHAPTPLDISGDINIELLNVGDVLSNHNYKPDDDVLHDPDVMDNPDDDIDDPDDVIDEATDTYPTNIMLLNKLEHFEEIEGDSPVLDISMDTSLERILKVTDGNLPTPSAVDRVKLLCPLDSCGSSFKSLKQLKQHQCSSHPDLYCANCGKLFSTRLSWDQHICVNQCALCRRLFKSSADLKQHMAIHANVKSFTCDLCGNSFRQRSVLDRHKLTHSDVKAYHCVECNKYFRHKHYLTVHMRTHTGERLNECDVCYKTFTQRSNLTKHMKQKHSTGREFVCSFCNKGFVGQYYLKRHLITHKDLVKEVEYMSPLEEPEVYQTCLGIRTIRCDLCSVTVKNEENLLKHKNDYH